MKKIGLAAAIVALMSSGALGADVFGRGDSLKDSGSVPAAKSWQGPYVGVGIGYRWHNWDSAKQCLGYGDDGVFNPGENGEWTGKEEDCWDTSKPAYKEAIEDAPGAFVAAQDEDADSWIVTGRVGHDWQSGRVVFGVFGEINWLDAGTTHFPDADFLYGGGARLGYLLNDRLLAYVNGGIELTDYSGLDTKVDPFLGGGLELLLADGWSVAGEGRYTFADDGDLPATFSNNDPVTIRALLIKKF